MSFPHRVLQRFVFVKRFPFSKHWLALTPLASMSCALTLSPKDTESSLVAQPYNPRHLSMPCGWILLPANHASHLIDLAVLWHGLMQKKRDSCPQQTKVHKVRVVSARFASLEL